MPGSQVFDTRCNWSLIAQCVREATGRARRCLPREVRAVSATSMREGMVLYDAKGREIWACPNVDSRAGEEATELVASGQAQEIYNHAGDWVSITSPGPFPLDRSPRAGAVLRQSPTSACSVTGCSPSFPASSSPTRRWARARACSTSPSATGRIAVLDICGLERASSRPSSSPEPSSAAVTAQAACRDWPHRRGPRSSSAAPTPSSACSA